MKLSEIFVPLPLYLIESNVTYHTKRKPTVIERMVLRLCDPGCRLPDKQNLSLLSVFREQLGAGDVRELLEGCVSELSALGALSKSHRMDVLEEPLTQLELSDLGLQFLRSDSLPVRSRTIKVIHHYDPISDEIKSVNKNDGKQLNTSLSRIGTADKFLRPHNPLPHVERAVAMGTYDWKSTSTVIDRIVPTVQPLGMIERLLEISCSEDGSLSVRAPRDAALQSWLERAESELVWEILLSHALKSEPSTLVPVIDSSILRHAVSARPVSTDNIGAGKARLQIIAEGFARADETVPTIVFSSEVNSAKLFAVDKKSTEFRLLVPTPSGMMTGFRRLALTNLSEQRVQAELAGNINLYWAGQSRLCGLTVTINHQVAKTLWSKLQRDLEVNCDQSDDPRIAFMSLAWRDVDTLRETLWLWLSVRAEQPLRELFALLELAKHAVNLWLCGRENWESVWESSLVKAIEKSLMHTPYQLEHEEVISLFYKLDLVLPADKRASLQAMLLSRATPIVTMESFAKLRLELPSTIEIPEELISFELRKVWLENALNRKELRLYGPHALKQPMEYIEKAVQDVYRNIGIQALDAAITGQMDVRTLTNRALDSVTTWRKATEHFNALNTISPNWNALNEAVESWNLLAQEKLAPVDLRHRIVVFDTSVLMDDPEILHELCSNDVPIIPDRVLSELDGLKESLDETRSAKARAAIRKLDANSSSLRHETEYKVLLPSAWDANQADNAILSTALFFRLNNVLFLSNDINLRNKAKSLGLNTQDSKSYRTPTPGPEACANKDLQMQGKKKKQRK